MAKPVISVEHLSKQYDLGVISSGTLSRDLTRWWAKLRGKPDPYSRIGQKDAFELIGESILALDDVSFKVNQGEALGIIGRNGAGKSTLLKILSRVTAPSSGLVKVKGRIGSLLEVGTGFHPELTGRENVYLNGSILGMRKEEVSKKFDEIVDFSGVERFIDTPVKRYSSGMYVRLAFAVAAHLDPEILIVDEVLAVGDAEFQKKCLGKMGDVAGEGRTVLFVSHNMGAIQTLCKTGICLENGGIKSMGDIETVIEDYLLNPEQPHLAWVNDGEKSAEAFFESIYVADENWEPTTTVFAAKQFRLVAKIKLQAPLRNLHMSLDVLDQYGNLIFVSSPRDVGLSMPSEPGDYQLHLTMPPGTLLARSYSIRLNLYDPSAYTRYDRVEQINFLVVENQKILDSTGKIGVLCEWSYS